MKIFVLSALLLCSVAAFAQQSKSADYPLTVHVSRSMVVTEGGGKWQAEFERIFVLIDGKKYVLEGALPKISLLRYGVITPGDYKARVTDDHHKGNALTYREYELLFPDGNTNKFTLVGESE